MFANYFFEHNNIEAGSVIPILALDDLNTDHYFAANLKTDRELVNKIKKSLSVFALKCEIRSSV